MKNSSLFSTIGSPLYIAPEVIKGEYDHKCDIWGAGGVLYLLLCGSPPFEGAEYSVLFKILNDPLVFKDSHSEEDRQFIMKLMDRNPKTRYEASEALEDPWISSTQAKVDDLFVVETFS